MWQISSSADIASTESVVRQEEFGFFLTLFHKWLDFILQMFLFVVAPLNPKNRF